MAASVAAAIKEVAERELKVWNLVTQLKKHTRISLTSLKRVEITWRISWQWTEIKT
jgi:hypothetical protein